MNTCMHGHLCISDEDLLFRSLVSRLRVLCCFVFIFYSKIDFFQIPSLTQRTDILVPPRQLKDVKKSLRKMKMPYEVINQDIET